MDELSSTARLLPTQAKTTMRKILVIGTVLFAATAVFAFRLVLLALGSVLYLYLLPGITARNRRHPRQREIHRIGLFGGWLVLPWIVALWMATRGAAVDHLYVDSVLAVHGFED